MASSSATHRATSDPEPGIGTGTRHSLGLEVILALLVAVSAIIACYGAREGGFVLDDQTYVVRNPAVVGDASPWVSPTPPDRPELGLYRPLTIATYRWQFEGVGLDASAFRTFNLALHAIVSALVFWVARRLRLSRPGAFFAGAFFAVHPVHAEAVGWIVGRAELLATFFSLLAILARPDGRSTSSARSIAAAGCYAAAALSKESALALPLVLVMLDRFEGASWRATLGRVLGYGAIAVASIALRISILGRWSPDVSDHPILAGLDLPQRLELAFRVMALAAENLALPFDLSIYYEPRTIGGAWRLILGVVIAVLALFALLPRHALATRAGSALLCAGLLPILHLVPIGWLFGDRFLYLPSVGFVLLAASLGSAMRSRGGRIVGGSACLAAAFALCVGRMPVFASDLSLWRDAVAKDPASGFAHHQLAGLLKDEGRLEYVSDAEKGAVHHWMESLRVEPDHLFAARAHLELGHYSLARLDDPTSALTHYRAVVELDPELRMQEGIDARLAIAALATGDRSRGTLVSEAEAVAWLRTLANVELAPDSRAIAGRLVERLKDSPAFTGEGPSAEQLLARFASR